MSAHAAGADDFCSFSVRRFDTSILPRIYDEWPARILPKRYATMLRLNSRQRTALSETVRELANLVAAALVLSRFIGGEPASPWLAILGVVLWVVFVGFAVLLEGGRSSG